MAIRYQHLFLGLGLAGLSSLGLANQDESQPSGADQDEDVTITQVIEPDIKRRTIKTAEIDQENFEVGAFYGIISIEDFDSSDVAGLRAAYHITEDFFVEASYGQAQGDRTSFEELSGSSPLFSEEDRDYTYYDLSLGWNIFPGEVFIANRYAFNSAFYLIGGAGSTEFLGDNWFTVNVGAGYRLLINDTFALHLDVRDHIFDRDSFGTKEQTHNVQFNAGLTIFF